MRLSQQGNVEFSFKHYLKSHVSVSITHVIGMAVATWVLCLSAGWCSKMIPGAKKFDHLEWARNEMIRFLKLLEHGLTYSTDSDANLSDAHVFTLLVQEPNLCMSFHAALWNVRLRSEVRGTAPFTLNSISCASSFSLWHNSNFRKRLSFIGSLCLQ